MISVAPTPAWLRLFAKIVAVLTLFLIFAGAMVTSTGSGLSVPDWPLNYGVLIPKMVGGVLYEAGHRLIAGSVGFLTVVLAVCLQFFEPKKFVRKLGWCSVGAVIFQGVLGGMTVLFLQPHALSIAHAAVAEIFFCLNVSIAYFTHTMRVPLAPRERGEGPGVRGLSLALVAVVYSQILLGALVRHLGAGTAIPDFPLSNGRIIPSFNSGLIAANFAHRAGALAVTILILTIATHCFRGKQFRGYATLLLALLGTQIFLGAKVVWDYAANQALYHSLVGQAAVHHASITSMHVMTGAAMLATSLMFAFST